MGKQLNAVEINVEILDNVADQSPAQLNELSLSLVGGGAVSVNF